ncbi:hypothetical protein HPB51_015671 [Rhipicephalus microplus]|uniref:Uncharacterized protein n=1 Tax=Rhipicephalus microplus TaxID=6941 RepID=A0A9J6D5H5_RHIMP|nr:hypothetical protein HPB51_015671 [Rhipicephalus microplus]
MRRITPKFGRLPIVTTVASVDEYTPLDLASTIRQIVREKLSRHACPTPYDTTPALPPSRLPVSIAAAGIDDCNYRPPSPPRSQRNNYPLPRTPLAPQPVQTIPLPATGHIDSTPAAVPCTVAFAAETSSAELSVPGDLTTSAGPADLPADSPPVPAPVEARDTTHAMDPEPAVTLHAISFPCTPVPAAQNLVECQHLLTSFPMYPTEVQAREHARLNVHDALTMSENPEGRTPGSPQVEHTVHAPTYAQLNHPPTTTCACLSISTPSTAHDNCDATYPPLDLASPNVGSSSNNATTHRRTPTRYTSPKVEKAIYQCPLSRLVITVNHVALHWSKAHRFQLICTLLVQPGGRRSR